MSAILTTSTSVWLMVILVCSTATASVFAAQAWQQARRPFVTFDQRSAENRMQNWLLLTAALLCVTFITLGILRSQESANAVEASAETPSPLTIAELVTATPTFQPTATPRPAPTPTSTPRPRVLEARAPAFQLPSEYSGVAHQVPTNPDTTISNIVFASRISDNLRPLDPEPYFLTEIETLYATFEYRNMADDMVWSWVWRKGGTVIDGGNAYWSFGGNGPGYIFLAPEEGFEPGIYSAEIWVNDAFFQRTEIELFAKNTSITSNEPIVIVTTPEFFKPPLNLVKNLPPVYDQVKQVIDLGKLTTMEITDFGLEMVTLLEEEEQIQGIRPIALTANFQHNAMQPGMAWSWVWRHEDEVIGGGNQLWTYTGTDTRGIIHLLPNVVESGEYSLELWVNGVQISRAIVNVTSG